MLVGGYFFRGILCFVIAILYGVLAYMYSYYHRHNEVATMENLDEQLLFGPNNLLKIELGIFFATFVMYVFLAIVFIFSYKSDERFSELVAETCKGYVGIGSLPKEYLKQKLGMDSKLNYGKSV